jgi:exopolysaccharide transport family protein
MQEMEEELHLRDYLKVIIKRKNSVLTFAAIIIVVISASTLSETPFYRATTRVLIDKEGSNIVNLRDPYYEGYYSEDYYRTQYELIRSMAVASKVVKNLDLGKNPAFTGTGGKKEKGLLSSFWTLFTPGNQEKGTEAKAGDPSLELARRVLGGLKVDPVKNSRMVNISYEHPDPFLAATIANGIANAYVEQVLDIRMGTTRHAVDWMTKKLDEQKAKLEDSQKAIQEYAKNKDIVAIENKETITPQKIQNLGSQLMAAEAKRRETEALYNQVRGLGNNPLDALTIPAIAGDPVIQSLREEEIRIEKQTVEMSRKFGDRHPQMIKMKGDLKSVREKMSSEIKRVISALKNEYELSKANESSLRTLFAQGKGEAIALSERSMRYDVLRRELDTNQQIYEALLKRVKETTLVEEVKSFNIFIVDRAEVPKSPVRPNTFKNILFALIVGMCGGVGIAFFLEYLDNTFKGPQDIEEKLALPLLGIVPLIKKPDEQGARIETLLLTNQKSSIAESYKALRTSVLLSSGDPIKSVVITSSVEDEGKTTTAINIAVSFAQLEQRVLLVDADLRKPKVHTMLGIDNSVGLSSYLTRQTIQENIRGTKMPNLSFLSAGPLPPNPSELLSSRRMKDFVEYATNHFDMVVFDSAPLITVTDTIILSALADGTVLVVKAGKTTFDIAKRGTKLLMDANIKILGTVLNGMDTEKEGYRYLYPYYYQYGQERKKAS